MIKGWTTKAFKNFYFTLEDYYRKANHCFYASSCILQMHKHCQRRKEKTAARASGLWAITAWKFDVILELEREET